MTLSAVKWTLEGIEDLGPTTTVPIAASVMGISPDLMYSLIKRGEWTHTRVLRLGARIRIPTRDLVRLLYDDASAGSS